MSLYDNLTNESDDLVIGLDYDKMYKWSTEEFAYHYCMIEEKNAPTEEIKFLQDRILSVYNKEIIRRVTNRIMHPDDFEKACEAAYIKLEEERFKLK